MAEDFSDEEWQRIDKGIETGAFSPKQLKLLSELRLQRSQRQLPLEAPADPWGTAVQEIAPLPVRPAPDTTEPPLVAAVRSAWDWGKRLVEPSQGAAGEGAAAPADPRATSPWYQSLVKGYSYGDPMDPTSAIERAKDEHPDKAAQLEQGYQGGVAQGQREMLEWLPTIIAAIYPPAGAAAGAYKGAAALYHAVGQPLLRAAYTYLGQNAAERLANIVDPAHKTDPEQAAMSEATGEFVGSLLGRGVDKVAGGVNRLLRNSFGETAEGTVRREVLEGLGEQPTLGMVSEKYWPKGVDTVLSHQPFTERVRGRYESVQHTLQQELDRHSALHPGSRVTERSQPLIADVEAVSTPAILHSAPRVLRTTRDEMITSVNKDLDAVYGRLDTDYLTRPLNWGSAKPNLPSLYGMQDLLTDPNLLPQVGGGSLFGDVVRLNQALLQAPDTITLASAYDLLKTVRAKTAEVYQEIHLKDELVKQGQPASPLTESLQKKVLPELGKIEDQLNQLVRPYLVDMTEAKRKAAGLLHDWEEVAPGQFKMTQASLQGGQAARFAVMDDPHIQAARGLLLQPNFMSFVDAHQARAKLYQVARQEGPLVDNIIAKNGQEMGDLVDKAMTATATRISPNLEPHWRDANRIYSEAKSVYDSALMHEFKDMNLDDILTKLVKTKRPNDMAMLRDALGKNPAGADVFDTASQMWLTTQIEEAKRLGGPAGMDTAHLLKTFKTVDEATERALFPRGELSVLKDKLERVRTMELAVDEASSAGKVDALKLYNYRQALSGAEWQSVQSDTLAHMFTGGTDPVSGKKLLDGLNKLHKANAAGVLFQPDHLNELQRLAHTARYMEDAGLSGKMHWNPLIRMGEHAMPAGAGLLIYAATHNPALAAAGAASWVVSSQGLAYLLTQPQVVKLLTQGMTMPVTAQQAGELTGMILAQLNNGGYQKEVTPVPAPSAPAGAPVAAH